MNMRKYAIGFICGAMLVSASAVYAGEAIKATLFPVKYEINGVTSELPEGYHTLNVEGRAYVPIRFAAESLDTVVTYDDEAKTIRIDDGYNLTSIASEVRAGHIQVVKNGNTSQIIGKLYAGQNYWDAMYGSKMELKPGSEVNISANIVFYNDASKVLGRALVSVSLIAKGDQIKEFEAIIDGDVSSYSFATLEYVSPEPIYAFLPPSINITDTAGNLAIGVEDVKKSGDYTKARLSLAILKKGSYRFEALITFYDNAGEVLGTAEVNSEGS
jgi:hypothetical protein